VSKQRRRGRVVWAVIGGLVVLLGSTVAFAQEIKLGGKFRTGREVVVAADETVTTDLYATAGNVRIEGTVEGDVVASGGNVDVRGSVGGDLLVGTGNADISGEVTGDARIGAGRVLVSGSIGEDLSVGTGQITLSPSGTVGEDFLFASGQTSLEGTVEGNVVGTTGDYARTGTVGGTEEVNVVERGEVTFGDRSLYALQRFVAILLIGLLLLWLVPRLVDGSAETLRRRPWASLGVGLLGAIGFVLLIVAIFLVMILLSIAFGLLQLETLLGLTVFGSLTGVTVVTFLFWLLVFFGAQAVVGMFLGRLAVGTERSRRWLALALGVLIVVVLFSIPIVGIVLGILIALFGLGAVILEYWPRRRAPEPMPAPAVP
jgi:cytoskeletal protein CcmA (bactofilin family)